MNSLLEKKFGAAVRERRRRLGLSQESLAQKADLHRTYLCDVERGRRNLSLESIGRIASGLNCSLAELFSGFTDVNATETSLVSTERNSVTSG